MGIGVEAFPVAERFNIDQPYREQHAPVLAQLPLPRLCDLTGVSQRSGCSRSSELFRQEFSVDSFLKPPTVFHTGLVDAPAPQFNGEFRSANLCKYVRSS